MTHPDIETVARAMCKSRTCEGFSCCQWPANRGRRQCPVTDGGYDDAVQAAITAIFDAIAEPTPAMIEAWSDPNRSADEDNATSWATSDWSAMLRAKRLEMLGEGK